VRFCIARIFCGLDMGSDWVLSGGRVDVSVDDRSSRPLDRRASCDLVPYRPRIPLPCTGYPFLSDGGFLCTPRQTLLSSRQKHWKFVFYFWFVLSI